MGLITGILLIFLVLTIAFCFQLCILTVKEFAGLLKLIVTDFLRLFSPFMSLFNKHDDKNNNKNNNKNNISTSSYDSSLISHNSNPIDKYQSKDDYYKDENTYKAVPSYNPFHPERGFFKYELVEKGLSDQEIKKIKEQVSLYDYKNACIDEYSYSVLDISEKIELSRASRQATESPKSYYNLLMTIAHIYLDYGYITVKMVEYALDIPRTYAYVLYFYLFSEEHPKGELTSRSAVMHGLFKKLSKMMQN